MFGGRFLPILLILVACKAIAPSSDACACGDHCQCQEPIVDYGVNDVQAYAANEHGPDGKLLLDQQILPFLDDVKGAVVLDAGCGAGPWSLKAAQKGAIVHGVDIQSKMIEKAKLNASQEKLDKVTFFQLGDARALSYPTAFFDKTMSINLICHFTYRQENCTHGPSIDAHFSELHRVLKPGGKALITGPDSMTQILTTGKRPKAEIIQEVKDTLSASHLMNEEQALLFVRQFKDILRASFVIEQGRLVLVESSDMLKPGQKVLRKIPGLSLYINYHPEALIVQKLNEVGFEVIQIKHPVLVAKAYQQQLGIGDEYQNFNPFFLIEAQKAG